MEQVSTSKELSSNKRPFFNSLVVTQKATGEFVGIETMILEMKGIQHDGIDQLVINTTFVILLLKKHFMEYQLEWKLMVKKAQQWLDNKHVTIPQDVIDSMTTIIDSLTF